MPILVFQHHDIGMPGRLGATLRDHGFTLDVRRPDLFGVGPRGLPTDLDNVQGLLVLGGPQNVTDIDALPWMQHEAALIKQAHAKELPVLGICLGHQLIAHALGGKVEKRTEGELLGFAPISIVPVGQTETMLSGMHWNHHQFFACGQEVTALPPGATLLATSKHTKHVIFRAGIRTFAFQPHIELDRPLMDALAGSSVKAIAAQADEHYAEYARLCDRLSINIATYCFPVTKKLSA